MEMFKPHKASELLEQDPSTPNSPTTNETLHREPERELNNTRLFCQHHAPYGSHLEFQHEQD
jgi:hypothetical protein